MSDFVPKTINSYNRPTHQHSASHELTELAWPARTRFFKKILVKT